MTAQQIADELRQARQRRPPPVPDGMDGLAYGLAGLYARRGTVTRRLREQAEAAAARSHTFCGVSDDRLRRLLAQVRERFRRHPRSADAHLDQALALIAEASARALGRRPYPAQLMAALALYRGALAQMATGEGKTLTAGLAAVLFAWTGRPCHVITVNDYLVKRDAELQAPLFDISGVSAGCVISGMAPAERRAGYAADVTYATGKEILADFLRDRLALGHAHDPSRRLLQSLLDSEHDTAGGIVMRGLGTAVVDEADSVLIDEAVTPLIIALPAENAPLKDGALAGFRIACGLERGRHYHVDVGQRRVRLTAAGSAALVDAAENLPSLWRGTTRREDLVLQALFAKELFHCDQHYVIDDGKVVIVDEFTGRMMPGRTWSAGLHQAIEAKETVEITDPTEIRARMSFQHFYRHYPHLCGMTGTAQGIAGELWGVYGLPVVRIPTHRPIRRRLAPDRVFAKSEQKWQAVAEAVLACRQRSQPVLVGTRSVEASEALSERLRGRGVECKVLNALHHAEEAAIVATAGQRGATTIATNMAGRGTDIALGEGVGELGGLHVIATERHEAIRVDWQLFGRCGRQGDPGSAAAYLSLDDSLPRRFVPETLRRVAAFLSYWPGGSRLLALGFRPLQWLAQHQARQTRRALLRADLRRREAMAFTAPDGTGD